MARLLAALSSTGTPTLSLSRAMAAVVVQLVSDLDSHYPPEHPPAWWIRFFDYL
jgi:hypothetical protein